MVRRCGVCGRPMWAVRHTDGELTWLPRAVTDDKPTAVDGEVIEAPLRQSWHIGRCTEIGMARLLQAERASLDPYDAAHLPPEMRRPV